MATAATLRLSLTNTAQSTQLLYSACQYIYYIYHNRLILAALQYLSNYIDNLLSKKWALALAILISKNSYLFTNKYALKHYTRRISRVALQLQALYHTSQIIYYRSYILSFIPYLPNYTYNLKQYGYPKYLIILPNYSTKQTYLSNTLSGVRKALLP